MIQASSRILNLPTILNCQMFVQADPDNQKKKPEGKVRKGTWAGVPFRLARRYSAGSRTQTRPPVSPAKGPCSAEVGFSMASNSFVSGDQ